MLNISKMNIRANSNLVLGGIDTSSMNQGNYFTTVPSNLTWWLPYYIKLGDYKIHMVIQEMERRKLPTSLVGWCDLINNMTNPICINQTQSLPFHKLLLITYDRTVLVVLSDISNEETCILSKKSAFYSISLTKYEVNKNSSGKMLRHMKVKLGENQNSLNTIIDYLYIENLHLSSFAYAASIKVTYNTNNFYTDISSSDCSYSRIIENTLPYVSKNI